MLQVLRLLLPFSCQFLNGAGSLPTVPCVRHCSRCSMSTRLLTTTLTCRIVFEPETPNDINSLECVPVPHLQWSQPGDRFSGTPFTCRIEVSLWGPGQSSSRQPCTALNFSSEAPWLLFGDFSSTHRFFF